MKIYITISLVLLCSTMLFAQNNLNSSSQHSLPFQQRLHSTKPLSHNYKITNSNLELLDSTIQWTIDPGIQSWVIYTKDIYSYDASNNLINDLEQITDGLVYNNLYTYSYDANNNLINVLYQNWNNNVWTNISQNVYSYDASNNQTSSLYQTWNGSAWVNSKKDSYTYDVNNNLINDLQQNWDGNTWVNFSQFVYTYDANSNQNNRLYQKWYNSAWVNYYQDIYTYDANNNQTVDLNQNFIANGTLENSNQYTFNYDSNNNQTSNLTQTWLVNAWLNVQHYNFTYDANNYIQTGLEGTWNGTSFSKSDSTHYYYHQVTTGITSIIDQTQLSIYPNPTNGVINIASSNNLQQIEIYNLLGEKVYESKPNNSNTAIDLSEQSKGIYFIKTYTEKGIKTQKILLQ